jgi:hypothetical protein
MNNEEISALSDRSVELWNAHDVDGLAAYWDLANFLRQTGVLPAGAESAVGAGD